MAWGLLFLSSVETSAIEVIQTRISSESPVSTDATCRAIFESVLRDKTRSFESGKLDEWNLNVSQAEAGRRLFERRQVESRIRHLALWFKDVQQALPDGFSFKSEFGDGEGDGWGIGERYLLRAVPLFAESTFIWVYRHVNSLLYEQYLRGYQEFMTTGKRATVVKIAKRNDKDSLVGAYIASDDSSSLDEEDEDSSDDEKPIVTDPDFKIKEPEPEVWTN